MVTRSASAHRAHLQRTDCGTAGSRHGASKLRGLRRTAPAPSGPPRKRNDGPARYPSASPAACTATGETPRAIVWSVSGGGAYHDGGARWDLLEVRDEPDAARVALVGRVVEADLLRRGREARGQVRGARHAQHRRSCAPAKRSLRGASQAVPASHFLTKIGLSPMGLIDLGYLLVVLLSAANGLTSTLLILYSRVITSCVYIMKP